MLTIPGNRRALALTLLALCVTAVVVLSLALRSSQADAAGDEDAVAALARSYPVLATPATAADLASDRPTDTTAMARNMPELLPAQGRTVARDSARTLVLVPRVDGQICLLALFESGDAGVNCNSSGTSPVLITYGHAIGTVPATVSAVTFGMTDGSSRTVPPEAGLYDAPAEASSVRYTDDVSGAVTSVELMPASARPKGLRIPPL